MILYHGSQNIIEKPYYKGGRPHNDYGYGFYCTKYPDIAREWAVTNGFDGYLNSYDFDDSGLKILDLDEHSIMTWLAILLKNRVFVVNTPLAAEARQYIISEFSIDYNKYDVICGYRADDSYFSFAQDFISNTISIEQLKEAMYLGNLGRQIVLFSKRSYDNISFLTAEPVSREPWFTKKNERDSRARKSYLSMDRKSFKKGGLYVLQILDEEIRIDDPRIR